MHRVRRNERYAGTSTYFNAAADTGAERSNKATGNRTDPWHNDAGAESIGRRTGKKKGRALHPAFARPPLE